MHGFEFNYFLNSRFEWNEWLCIDMHHLFGKKKKKTWNFSMCFNHICLKNTTVSLTTNIYYKFFYQNA